MEAVNRAIPGSYLLGLHIVSL
ncbi:MAG: hypothetical protein JWR44_378, partial [Hymenobacter sp.]|nr:hypothetical protein [Hymenobacter sp.]